MLPRKKPLKQRKNMGKTKNKDKEDLEELIGKVTAIRKEYINVRNNSLARSVIIRTSIGDYPITNPSMINKVLDLLISETQQLLTSAINAL